MKDYKKMNSDKQKVDVIKIKPIGRIGLGGSVTIQFGGIKIYADDAKLDIKNNLVLSRNRDIVACIKVNGIPLEVPHMINDTIQNHNENIWDINSGKFQ